jgi:hypothetical protein
LNNGREQIERILGGKVTPFDEQPLPGIEPLDDAEVVYFADSGIGTLFQQFDRLTEKVDAPAVKGGGVATTRHAVGIPDGRLFHAIKYRGDLAGWRRQIAEGAKLLGISLGKIENGETFTTSDGLSIPLSMCKHERI